MTRVADCALGLSVASWGLVGFLRAPPEERLSPVRIALSLLQLGVGLLIVVRRPVQERATTWELAAGLPSFLVGGLAVTLARPLSQWPLAAEALFVAAGTAALLSLASLGRCFAILPGARGVVATGPYRIVRHPAYACELLMVAACGLAAGLPWGPLVAAATLPLLVLRILAEERPLRRLEAYTAYASRVRFRLVPGIW